MLKLLRVTLLVSVLASPASGATMRPDARVAVLSFAGDDGRLRAQVVRMLRVRHFQIIAPATEDAAALAGPEAVALIDGRVKVRGWKWVLTVRIRSTPAGHRLGTATFTGGRAQIGRDITRHFGRRAGPALASAIAAATRNARTIADAQMEPIGEPPGPARPVGQSRAEDVEDEPLAPRGSLDQDEESEQDQGGDDDDDDHGGGGSRTDGPEIELVRTQPERRTRATQTLDFSLGMHLFTRHFHYEDPVGTLTPYRLLWAPAPAATLEWFPFELIGLIGSGQIETGATTTDRDGTAFPTAHWAFLGGVQVRCPAGPLWLSMAGEYGVDAFRIDDAAADAPKPPVPSVQYEFIRLTGGLQVRPTSYLTLQLTAGYRHVFSAGEIETAAYFPHASIRAFDAASTLSIRLRRGVELRIAADFRRYQLQLRSQPTDVRMARGAFDDYVGGTISLAVLVGGRRGF